ncbi:MAG: ABC transporter ATP-binding protein [Chloroflexi bacterium]|nr:ABC transporter ATP-binding protein [Chloroflexota bacterium]MCI0577444.1 ABC transporter ATP-binding protein [Chloroflexota bacterium]MCI0649712.1 ABC transporter ATP-binding protein [Chloroflexota bacterium]MCI0725442.1 ABC transporter ATP-binding protein [Chloroflexota bacterium]
MAVDRINLIVPQGKIFGFIGPSGSGKTTTIRMMTGTYKPTAGEVHVLNVPPRAFGSSMRERIGYMPQLFVLYPELTVWENLNFTASLYGMFFRRSKRLKELLDFVELSEDRHKLVRNISGGMQRRLSLAATLAHNPEVLFLDEPTAGIDPILRRKFWDLFRELQGQGRTFFITTQYVSEAAYCGLVGVLVEGRLIALDTPEGLHRRAYGGDQAQPLRTVFVMQPDSPFRQYLEEYTSGISSQLHYAGATDNLAEAEAMLHQDEADVVVALPEQPLETIHQDQQAVFVLYHDEIDPFLVEYVRVFGQIYTDEVNRRVLSTIAERGQAERG